MDYLTESYDAPKLTIGVPLHSQYEHIQLEHDSDEVASFHRAHTRTMLQNC